MDTIHLDNLLSSLRSATSRRGLLAGLISGLIAVGLPGPREDAAAKKASKKKRKNKKRRKHRKDKNGPKVRVDATCAGSEATALESNGDDRMAQTFIAIASGALVKAQLSIGKAPGSAGDFEVRLSPLDESGTPLNEVLAVSSVANDQVPDEGGFVDFAFTKPFSVVDGTGYALVLTRPGGDRFQWSNEGGNPCGGEAFFAFGQTERFTPNNDDIDHTFTTFVKS